MQVIVPNHRFMQQQKICQFAAEVISLLRPSGTFIFSDLEILYPKVQPVLKPHHKKGFWEKVRRLYLLKIWGVEEKTLVPELTVKCFCHKTHTAVKLTIDEFNAIIKCN